MITLQGLAELAATNPGALAAPVAPLTLGDRVVDTDLTPVVMGTINLSRDSTYRDSIAPSTEAAVRRGRLLAAQGADLVDVGAESTNATSARVEPARQIDQLTPVVKALSGDGIAVSAETYDPEVAGACLDAGATVLNFTGNAHEEEIYDLVGRHGATLILCSVLGSDVRDIQDVERDDDPIPGYLAHFEERVALARSRGVEHVVVDPGLGFFYGNLTDPQRRIEYQTQVLLRTFELRPLGLPICHALPHAFDLFQEHFRSAEPFFAVLARLGGTGVFRTHEVPHVRAALDAMQSLSVR